MRRVYFHGTRLAIRQVARQLAAMLAGKAPDAHGIAEGFQLALGFGALSDIKDAFVTKAAGGTDEMGISWPDLSPKTKAYSRRFGPGEQARLKRGAGLGRGHRFAPGDKKGLLTATQLKAWRALFVRHLNRLRLSMPETEAKGRAAAIAWTILKREGAQTKLNVYGNRTVQVLRDTGQLLNSLSPGLLTGQPPSMVYSAPTGAGAENQVFQRLPGRVVVGTNDPKAGAHDKGVPGKLPRRQIFPDDDTQVPQVWWDRWLNIATASLEAGAEILYREAA